jgi:tripartite-type tricarboxylate transporter receptor subunit TctC
MIVALAALCAAPAWAQTYPAKPIHLVVPYAPGGVTDIAARLVGAKLTEALGQQVVVENRTGANGFIGVNAVTKAPADGYTLLVATVGEITINPALFKDIPYNVQRDLEPVAMLSDTPIVLAANVNSPFRSVTDVLNAAKAQPGRVSIASPGNGTMNHLAIEWMAIGTATKFQHIPYRGGAPSGAAVAAGDVPLGIIAISSALPHVKSGRARVLAVTTAKRSSFYPDWKTLQEFGVPDVDASNWVGVFAPKGTPQAIIDKLNAEVAKILAMPDVKERFGAGGAETLTMTSAALDARVRADTERLMVIVQKANLRPDLFGFAPIHSPSWPGLSRPSTPC